jgi:L-fuculose-phosphate aldolase
LRDLPELREGLIATARRLATSGLTRNTSGNVSCRLADGFLITPSGMAYERLKPDDLVVVDWAGVPHGRRLPSSEWRFHRDILAARPETNVVLHAHPPFATSLACLRRGIPPFHYMVAKAGGADIRCAPYATFGTQALSDHALAAIEGRKACLLANHGMIAVGKDFDAVLALSIEVETLAEMYLRACQIGEPALLSAEEMALNVEKFHTYGYQPEIAEEPS